MPRLGLYPYQVFDFTLSRAFESAFITFNQELHESAKISKVMANMITHILAKCMNPLVDQACLAAQRREVLEQMIAMPNEIVDLYAGLDRMEALDRGLNPGEPIGAQHIDASTEVAERLRSILGKMGEIESCYRENDRLRRDNALLHALLSQAGGGFQVTVPDLRPSDGDTPDEEIEVDL